MRLYLLLALCVGVRAQEIRFEKVDGAFRFRLEHFPTAEKLLPETMAGGLAVFDYNQDGKLDLFFANGAPLAPKDELAAKGDKAPNRLFRNEGNFRFTDVSKEAGLEGAGFAFGAAVADFDGDGWVDLYVPAWPQGQLFHNRGNGTFEDWSARLPLRSSSWNVAAGWFDYDRDGRPDLFLVHYLDWSPENNPWCGDRLTGQRFYCHPRHFKPLPNQLLHNLGGGKFEDVSLSSGIAAHKGKGMSVAFGDANGDGWLDAFVTNDTLPSYLFLNQKNGKFLESGLESGVSLPESGRSISAMGADFRDFDNDGREDIVISALARETFPLFRQQADAAFREVTDSTRLSRSTAPYSGWGIGFADLDNDGWKDLLSANSHVNDQIESTSADRYRQPLTIFRNEQGKTFSLASLGTPEAHRGLLSADLDNDGRLDLISTALGESPSLWRNISSNSNSSLDIEAPLGTWIRIGTQTQRLSSAVGYSSSALLSAHFGFGQARPVLMEIVWPDGSRERQEIPSDVRRLKIQKSQATKE